VLLSVAAVSLNKKSLAWFKRRAWRV